MNSFDIALGLTAGLAIFLFGVTALSESLESLAGDRMKRLLERFTANPVVGLLTGCVATIALDSSSLTIILVIALVHAGALTLRQSLGVILGANIGTTISSQIFALEIDRFAPALLGIGLLLILIRKDDRVGQRGRVVFSIGLVLFGLRHIGETLKPLAESESLESWMHGLENPVLGAAVGAGVTALIQSSSAMVGIVIKLAAAGLIALPSGVALMLGAEIGTCLDCLIASIGRTRAAVRAAVFQFGFNVAAVAIGLVFAHQIAVAAVWLPSGGSVARQIANAHVLFNCTGALLCLPLVSTIASLLESAIPARAGQDEPPVSGAEAPEMA
jgi:phosphate:Na+ symporter